MPHERRIRIGLALALWLGTAALYWPIHDHAFVRFDDPHYVAKNEFLEDGLTPAGLARTFTTASHSNWHPLTTISYAIDYQLHGREQAGGYLVTNLLLHATATLLLFLALARLTGALGRSAFVAAIFGLHPLHVESVAWVSERKDVLSGVFFAALLWVYAAAARAPTPARRLAVAVLLALGLLAKPMLVTVPFLLLLLDFWPLARIPADRLRSALPAIGRLAVEKIPLFGLAAASAAVTYWAQSASGAVQSLEQFSLSSRLMNVPISYLAYLKRAFWPSDLAFFYPMVASDLTAGPALLATAVLGAITVAAFVLRRRAPYLLLGWLWFVGMLVPVIGLVQVGSQSMADRYTYLPLIGLAIALAWGAVDLAGARRAARIAVAGAGAAAVAALAVVSAFQIATWRDDETVAVHALAVTRANVPAHFLLAGVLLERGRTGEARAELQAAFALRPDCPECHGLLGEVYETEGAREQAVTAYAEALRLNPSLLFTRAKLGQTLIDLGRPDEALAVLEQASPGGRDSGSPLIHVLLGRAYERRGDPAAAAKQYRDALQLSGDYAEAHANLGLLLAAQNQLAEGEAHLRRAQALGLELAEVHVGLADVLQRQGRMVQAAEAYRAALRLRPEWAVPANNLAWILATEQDPALRRPEEAVTFAESAVRETKREDPAVLDTLSVAYAAAGRRDEALATAREALALARAKQLDALVPLLSERVQGYESAGGATR